MAVTYLTFNFTKFINVTTSLYILSNLCVCQSVFLCSLCTATVLSGSDMWHSYILRMVMSQLASAAQTRRLVLRTPSIYTAANGWRAPSWSSKLAGGRRNAPSTAGARSNRAQ